MSIAADPADAAREQFMLAAIEQARRSMAAGGPPVGACLVRDGSLLASAHNEVIPRLDITAHAEIVVLRQACEELRSLNLSGCELYVTVEPCLMCFAACSYAGISSIRYGASISVLNHYTGDELCVAKGDLPDGGPEMIGGLLAEDCAALVKEWGSSRTAGRVG